MKMDNVIIIITTLHGFLWHPVWHWELPCLFPRTSIIGFTRLHPDGMEITNESHNPIMSTIIVETQTYKGPRMWQMLHHPDDNLEFFL
jgi:hypothetical protein